MKVLLVQDAACEVFDTGFPKSCDPLEEPGKGETTGRACHE